MKKKNILLLTTYSNIRDGWSNISFQFRKYLNKKNYNITVVVKEEDTSNDKNIIKAFRRDSYYNQLCLIADTTRVYNQIKDKEFDKIIVVVEPFLPIASRLKKMMNIKELILVAHGTYGYYPFKYFPFKLFYSRFKKDINKIIVPSKVKEWFKGEIKIINWGVDLDEFYPIKNLRKENKSFFFIGQLKKRKGIDLLIDSFSKLVKDYPDAKLYLAGKSSKYWLDYVKEKKLDRNIKFLGKISHDDLLRYYTKSMATVIPSRNEKYRKGLLNYFYFEGFGLIHLESNACGTPSIGSKNTANEDAIIDGFSGYLVNYEDVNDIYEKMKRVIENKEEYSKLSKNSLKYAKDNTWDKVMDRVINFIES